MEMYTSEGWLNFPEIDAVAQRNRINFIIIIGKRQVGKTFGCLKLMLDDNRQFIFMRLTTTELDMLNKGVNSPFEKVAPNEIIFKSESQYSSEISRIATRDDGAEDKTRIGMGAALSTIGKIRGFNGDPYTDLVIDEAIPESHLFKVRDEESAFLNAHTTINGNRELEGRPCLKTWILANSNNLNSGILNALHLIPVIERMILRGEEFKMLVEQGVMILLPDSNKVIEERKKGGLYRAIGGKSDFARMAYENEFSYNDFTNVRSEPLREYIPYITVGDITIHMHKSDKRLYVTARSNAKVRFKYTTAEKDMMRFSAEHVDLQYAFKRDRIIFNSQEVKIKFRNYLKI